VACDASPHAAHQPAAAPSDASQSDAALQDASVGRADSSAEDQAMLSIKVKDFTFNARVAGPEDGELVLLLHGFPESSYQWRHQLVALAAAGYRAVAPDQRGYSPGARPTAVDDYQVLLLVQDILDLADALGTKRFHLVGHDWGAGVAWALARLAADRVITLTVVSTPHPDAFNHQLKDQSSCQYSASAYLDIFTGPDGADYFLNDGRSKLKTWYPCTTPEELAVYLDLVGNPAGIDAALNWYRANIKNRVFETGEIGAITVPTLYVWGEDDPFFCRDTAELSRQFVTGPYRFEVVTGVGHYVSDCAPDRLNALLLSQLRSAP
jgi:pimeloyl-ACP methyl ester carboxylesterase